MAEPIMPIGQNTSAQSEAVAGSSAAIFTATDRKIIEERGGVMDRKISFQEAIAQRSNRNVPKVENEATPVRATLDVKDVQNRYNKHKQMLKESPFKGEKAETDEEGTVAQDTPSIGEEKAIHEKTIAAAKELKFDVKELLEKFALGQDELHHLISMIKELHLKRLLTESHHEFDALSKKIVAQSVASVKPEAKDWLVAKLKELALEAAKYKLGLLQSLQIMDFDKKREKTIRWLKQFSA